MKDGKVWKKSQTERAALLTKLFWAQKDPIVIPKIVDIITAKVAIYAVISALSQYSDSAINKIKLPTIKADRIPPIIYPAPITKIKVDITGIPRYEFFIGTRTLVIRNMLKVFKVKKKVCQIQSTPASRKGEILKPLAKGTK